MLTVKLPPTIIRHPIAYRIYDADTKLIVLECVAEGSPTPQYGHIIHLELSLLPAACCFDTKYYSITEINNN